MRDNSQSIHYNSQFVSHGINSMTRVREVNQNLHHNLSQIEHLEFTSDTSLCSSILGRVRSDSNGSYEPVKKVGEKLKKKLVSRFRLDRTLLTKLSDKKAVLIEIYPQTSSKPKGRITRALSPNNKITLLAVARPKRILSPTVNLKSKVIELPNIRAQNTSKNLRCLSPISEMLSKPQKLVNKDNSYKKALLGMMRMYNPRVPRAQIPQRLFGDKIDKLQVQTPLSNKEVGVLKLNMDSPTSPSFMDSSFSNASTIQKQKLHINRKRKLRKLISEEEIQEMKKKIWNDLDGTDSSSI